MRTLNLLARPVVALLLGFASFAVTVQAFPLVNQRPGNVLTMIMAGCGKQQSWQAIASAFAWRVSGQPGRMIRIANCDEEEANQPGSLRLAEYVDTFIAQEYTYYKPINDHYRAYNKPGGVIDYLAQHTPQEEWVIIIDSDTFIRHPFTPEELPAEPGWAYGSDHSFLYGINNGMALRHVPEIAPRNDTLGWPAGRRGDRVGGPYFLHRDDLAKVAPLWLEYSYRVRNDTEAYKDSGMNDVHEGDRIWIAEMYGYIYGAAKADVWHHARNDLFAYPEAHSGVITKSIHNGHTLNVSLGQGDKEPWTFNKHWYLDFEVHKCPFWDLTAKRPKEGIFPPPPEPKKLPMDSKKRYADLLSGWTVALVNAALCDFHACNCPASGQLTKACDAAFQLYSAYETALKDYEWDLDCSNQHESCRMWADNGECDKTPKYMHSHCRKSCKLCKTRKGNRTRSELEVHPLTVTGVMIAMFREMIEAESDAAKLAHGTDADVQAAAPSSDDQPVVAFQPLRRLGAGTTGDTGAPAGWVLLYNVQLVLLGVLLGYVAKVGMGRFLYRKSV